jgi:hypothetical protein
MRVDDGDPGNGTACNGTAGIGCWGLDPTPVPTIYDRFTTDRAGLSLLNPQFFPNPSGMLWFVLTSGQIHFDAPGANLANGGSPPTLYAPRPFQPGSSYEHLDLTAMQHRAMVLARKPRDLRLTLGLPGGRRAWRYHVYHLGTA